MTALQATANVFFSHASVDHWLVGELTKDAAAVGVCIYTHEEDPRPGEPIASKIQSRIRRSDAVLALLTKEGSKSNYVSQEIGFAISSGKLVVPLVEEGVPKARLGMLDGVEYIPFTRGDTESLRMALRKWLPSLAAKSKTAAARAVVVAGKRDKQIAVVLLAVALVLIVIYFSKRR